MNTQNTSVQQVAQSVGISLEVVQGGFLVFDTDDGQPFGNEPWSEENVLGFCKTLERGNTTGVYVV